MIDDNLLRSCSRNELQFQEKMKSRKCEDTAKDVKAATTAMQIGLSWLASILAPIRRMDQLGRWYDKRS